MKQMKRSHEDGFSNSWMVATISLIVVAAILAGLAVWSFVNYNDQKNNVDIKVSSAVVSAKKTQADSDEAKFSQREKEPNRQFVGPDDYGRVTFDYPKTWSVYIDKDATDGDTYEAYLNPITVPPVSSAQQFALRVTIEQKDYDTAITNYDSLVKKGDLKSSSVTVGGAVGTRLDGKFSDDIRGSAVIFKIRDKTLTIRTDADTFKSDFDKIITTIKFNQ
jgi:cytoskeletal protein RodZ